METEVSSLTPAALPGKLADVFRSLRSGKHICREDAAEYRDLDRNEELYRALFHGLGYELVHHGQGFYYFKGVNYLSSQRLQAISLFTLILFQDLEDKKFQEAHGAWERKLLMRTFSVNELPHFQTSQRRSILHTVGVLPDTLHDKVLRPMARYGMLQMIGTDQFQFRSPIYRFVDLCMQIADEDLGVMTTEKPLTTEKDEKTEDVAASNANDETDSAWTDEDDEEHA